MELSKIMDKKHIFIDVDVENKRQLLQVLSEKLSSSAKLDSRIIFDALLERENLGSTGFGGGTAVPHARIANIDNVVTAFARIKTPIDFNAVDSKQVDLVLLLLSPEDKGADHLTALARASRILKNKDMCSKLREEANIESIYKLLESSN